MVSGEFLPGFFQAGKQSRARKGDLQFPNNNNNNNNNKPSSKNPGGWPSLWGKGRKDEVGDLHMEHNNEGLEDDVLLQLGDV